MSWCHRLIAHDWLLSVCRPGRVQHVIYFRFRPIPQPLRKSTAPICICINIYIYIFFLYLYICIKHACLSLSLFLFISFFFSSLSSRPRATSASSRAVRFGIDAAADTGIKKKKIGRHNGKLCPRRGERQHGLTDLLQRPRTPRTLRSFSSLFARFRTLSPNVIRDLRHDGCVDSIG